MKNPALSAYGKIGGKKSSLKMKRKLGVQGYKKRMSRLAMIRWAHKNEHSKSRSRPSSANKKTLPKRI